MLLRLVIPRFDRSVQRGSVAKWHKAEGEWVSYGDDLLDLKVEEIKIMKRSSAAAAVLHDQHLPQDTYSSGQLDWLVRVTSSDVGVLRRIDAAEGSRWEIGDRLAVLTTDADEPIDRSARAGAEVSNFRVVVNDVQNEGGAAP